MDDLLPSYESVIQQNPFELVAPFLNSVDLCSAALVCQKWHEIFTPQLWGNPASHFGVQNDTVYVALTRFKRTLFYSRLLVRELTHTLHLPPAHAEIYGGPHYEWLRDCLERLPRLQSLIVNGLPFFDHASLLTLRHPSLWWSSTHPNAYPNFGLRLLEASGCSNVTSNGLSEALPHFPDLVTLDLSGTVAARDEVVFEKLKYLPTLRVLKLRGLALRDSDMSIIAPIIGMKVRSLDVSENMLSDKSVRCLLDHCLRDTRRDSHLHHAPVSPIDHARPRGEFDNPDTEDLDSHLRMKLTQGFVGSLALETARNVGITHLYLARNAITVEGVSGLLRSGRLQVLDVGTLPTIVAKPQHGWDDEEGDPVPLPSIAKLTPVLAECASKRLVRLRINYTIVTEDAPVETVPSPRGELAGDLGSYKLHDAHELDAHVPALQELDSNMTAIHELPGGPIEPVELPDTPLSPETIESRLEHVEIPGSPLHRASGNPAIEVTSETPEIKRGAAYAPEPVASLETPLSPLSPILDATGGLSPISTSFDTRSKSDSDGSDDTGLDPPRPRPNSTCHVEDRRAKLDLRQSQENRLHPGMLSKVHTLILTDVPSKTEDETVVSRIIQFITDCAEETEIARIRSKHTYILPPGRSRKVAEREYARGLFALRRIVLEMAPPQEAPKKISTSWRQYPTKSSTEDADSEAFWNAAAHDFSFFGDEECGLPSLEPGRTLPLTAMDGLMLAPQRPAPAPQPQQPQVARRRVLDVVSEIAQFRRAKKAAYHSLLQADDTDAIVEGHWLGDITVVRRPVNADSGSLDYYGNRFESGWLYR